LGNVHPRCTIERGDVRSSAEMYDRARRCTIERGDVRSSAEMHDDDFGDHIRNLRTSQGSRVM